jgi:iron complex outermembrane receptor protein
LSRNEIDTVTSLDPYAQASWKLDKWTLQAGVRHSHVKVEVDDRFLSDGDDSGDVSFRKTTPAVGVTYQLTPAVNLYASAATGFETPTVTEMSYSGSTGQDGFNLGLKPARSRQFELGTKAFVGDNTRINLAVFQIRTEDELVVFGSFSGRTVYQNAARTLRQGAELGIDSEFSRQWRGRLAITQLRAIYDDTFASGDNTITEGKRLPSVPATSAYGELAWMPRNGLTAAVEGVYRSRVFVEDTNTERTAPSYALVNLRFTADQQSGPWKISEMLRFDNIFDRTYIGSVIVGDRNGRFYEPGPSFSWYAGASARYTF